MAETRATKARSLWTALEDKALLEAVQTIGRGSWTAIAVRVSQQIPGPPKTGKQCRERYRNYVDPQLRSAEWTSFDKLLFILLHKIHGNKWVRIREFYRGRSDISLKNIYYLQFRRALMHVKRGTISSSTATKPEKLFRLYTLLDTVIQRYMPTKGSTSGSSSIDRKVKILRHLVRSKGVTSEEVQQFQAKMLGTFRAHHPHSTFPIILSIRPDTLVSLSAHVEELRSFEPRFNTPPLSASVVIKLVPEPQRARAERPLVLPSSLSLPFPCFPPGLRQIPHSPLPMPLSYPVPALARAPSGQALRPILPVPRYEANIPPFRCSLGPGMYMYPVQQFLAPSCVNLCPAPRCIPPGPCYQSFLTPLTRDAPPHFLGQPPVVMNN